MNRAYANFIHHSPGHAIYRFLFHISLRSLYYHRERSTGVSLSATVSQITGNGQDDQDSHFNTADESSAPREG
jgi:hypothetical protein